VVNVKICGITRKSDALVACNYGATALGFVFWDKSPRAVSPEQAEQIVSEIPPNVCTVGVFVNAGHDRVCEVVERVGLSLVQFHGDETLEDCARAPRRVLRAVGLKDEADVDLALSFPSDVTVLLDSSNREKRGGTGHKVDWSLARRISCERPIVLAGGITGENIIEAVETVRPFGLDVSSGVEERPGVKDPLLLKNLFLSLKGKDGFDVAKKV
tara:strand:- start:827 stop:1468 length:642 start_codon:yes stop_codon:yes gene_type:complete